MLFCQRFIELEATELKEKATNVEEALSDVNGFLQRLQDLAEEVSRNAFVRNYSVEILISKV